MADLALLRPMNVYRQLGGQEVFTAATLLLVLGSALFMEALGLSMALGAAYRRAAGGK
ncbi:hypothetical protein MJ585_25855 [Klebsiella pneumoniae]|nr:hypothetical protein MJ585_25855 [Klebsiella pneumoniae]